MTEDKKRRAVFFDRDGVINDIIEENGAIRSPRCLDEFRIKRDVKEGVVRLKEAGYVVAVVTNQPELSRGLIEIDILKEIHDELLRVVPFDEILMCPHDNHHNCDCRKPKPGMLIKAASKWAIDLERSYVIGDTEKDMKASIAAGCKHILIDTHYNQHLMIDTRVESVVHAVGMILTWDGGGI